MATVRILVAEERQLDRTSIRELVASHAGLEVCGEATDGWDAVVRAKSLRPDVVLLGVPMASLDSFDAVALIKKELPQTQVLILGEQGAEPMLAKALRAGARGFIPKSAADRDLVPALKQIAGHHDFHAEVAEQVARTQLEIRVEERTTELEQAHEALRMLNHHLMKAQEEERRRLALELHDSAGQLLVALKWKLEPLPQQVGKQNPEVAKLISDSLALVDELSRELRTVSHLLHPPLLDEAGLLSALRFYVEGLADRSGLMVELRVDPNLQRLPREVETTVFRIVQEALSNVHRHSKAKAAAVRVGLSSNGISVQIQDQGQGIPGFTSLDQTKFKVGVGIQGMQERIRQLKGTFEIKSGPGGTTLTAVLPVRGSVPMHPTVQECALELGN
jgi:signal transduction histidine kinase